MAKVRSRPCPLDGLMDKKGEAPAYGFHARTFLLRMGNVAR